MIRLTALKVQKILYKRVIDFLFIDGDHTYEGVKRDFEMCSLLVRKGGIIAFLDTVPHLLETIVKSISFGMRLKIHTIISR